MNGLRNDVPYQNHQLQSEWTVIWEAGGAVDVEGWPDQRRAFPAQLAGST